MEINSCHSGKYPSVSPYFTQSICKFFIFSREDKEPDSKMSKTVAMWSVIDFDMDKEFSGELHTHSTNMCVSSRYFVR